MKKFIILSLLFVTINSVGQALTYSEVIKVDSVSAKELYNRAKLWLASSYNSSKDVLQIDNTNDGQILGKALFTYHSNVFVSSENTKGNIKYTITITAKDGRYKYEITDFIHDAIGNHNGNVSFGLITMDAECPNPPTNTKGWNNRVWNDIKQQIGENIPPINCQFEERNEEANRG
jgi:hypothetical protein